MTIALPKKAMVLAAGKGTRMRPLTDNMPKALVQVDGTALIDHALDHLADAGVPQAMINFHYFGQQLVDHLAQREGAPQIALSDESNDLLETGGGVVKALAFFDDGPFFVINGDAIWTDDDSTALQRLADAFDPDTMDVLLLLVPLADAVGHPGAGDFFIHSVGDNTSDLTGRLQFRGDAESAPYVYASIHICHPDLYIDAPQGAFSLVTLWRRAAEQGRLFGLVHKGRWHDVGTPKGRDEAEQMLIDARTSS